MMNLFIMGLTLIFVAILFIEIDKKEREERTGVNRKLTRVKTYEEKFPYISDFQYRKVLIDLVSSDWKEEGDPIIDYKEYNREPLRRKFKQRYEEWEEELLREEESCPKYTEVKLFSF